jgi:hypothetical protein
MPEVFAVNAKAQPSLYEVGFNEQHSDHRGFVDKLEDEARMLWGAKGHIIDGIGAGLSDMWHHPVHALEVAGVAAGLALASRIPGAGPWILRGSALVGISTLLAPDAIKVWQSHDNLPYAQRDLGMKIGETVAYMPVGMAGYAADNEIATINWRNIFTNAHLNDAGTPSPAASLEKPVPPVPQGEGEMLELDKPGAQRYFGDHIDDMIQARKQLYRVKFERITPEMAGEDGTVRVPTLENPEGQIERPEQWIATRLNPDGSPNMERGLINQWTVETKTILKTYVSTPEQLEGTSSITLPTRTDAPPVHMVPLEGPTRFMSDWGPQVGDGTGWLANYDFDVAARTPGSSFAIITGPSFGQTYEAANPESASVLARILSGRAIEPAPVMPAAVPEVAEPVNSYSHPAALTFPAIVGYSQIDNQPGYQAVSIYR